MGVVHATWVKAGAAGVKYLTDSHGCADHASIDYYTKGAQQEQEPMAVWLGEGVGNLGFEAGQEVTAEDAMAVFGKLCDPRELELAMAAAEENIRESGVNPESREAAEERAAAEASARLGNEPRKFRTAEERATSRIAAEEKRLGSPLEPERAAQIRAEEASAQVRGANSYVDLTFSAQKSVSTYYVGLQSLGRVGDAAIVLGAHQGAIEDALKYGQEVAGYSRNGYHSNNGPGRTSTGKFVDAHDWIAARWDHFTSREGDPQLHSHLTVVNRVLTTDSKGRPAWLTLDSQAVTKALKGMAAVYERSLEERLTKALPVEFGMRPDGKSREILGIKQELLDAYSTRRTQITGRLAEYVEAYKEKHNGQEPSPYMLSRMADTASLATRKGKEQNVPMDTLLERWESASRDRAQMEVSSAVTDAEARAMEIRIERGENPVVVDRAQVISTAVDKLQSERATWGRNELMFELNRALPDHIGTGEAPAEMLSSLADEALNRGGYGVVQVDGFEPIAAPAELTRTSDGRSIYRPHDDAKYSTIGQLTKEEALLDLARRVDEGTARVPAEAVDALIAERKLVAGQAEAVRGVLTDGRPVSPIVGPAGTGKTTTTDAIRQGWQELTGGNVFGLAPSEVAASELKKAGVEQTMNTARWIERVIEGKGPAEEITAFTPRRGDMIVMDEASMIGTDHATQIIKDYARENGIKVVPVGDPGQLSAVQAGGWFRLLTRESECYTLDEVYRFKEPDGSIRVWEAEASLGVRAGDPDALDAYAVQGRIRGGDAETMMGKITDAYIADTLNRRDSVVITSSNEQAQALSMQIRERLVEMGRVEAEGTPIWGNQQWAGKGDLVQARENDHKTLDSEGERVLNRYVYRIEERRPDGSFTATRWLGYDEHGNARLGGNVTFSSDYVSDQITLAYAGTAHAVQGRTAHRGHGLFDETTNREWMNVALTRGAEANYAYVISKRLPTAENQAGLDLDPLELLKAGVQREGAEISATETLRSGLDYADSMGPLAAEYSLTAADYNEERLDAVAREVLSPENYQRLQDEDPGAVYRLVRGAELDGHDPEAVLREAIGAGSVDDARSMARLVYDRVEKAIEGREPEGPALATWEARVPAGMPENVEAYMQEHATAMDERQAVLGGRAAEDASDWMVERLGPVPQDGTLERFEWERRAGAIEAYREGWGAPNDRSVIGRPPAAGAVEQRAAWESAWEALGRPDDERRLAGMSVEQLQEMKARYEREQQHAPAYVLDDLRDSRTAHVDAIRDGELARGQATNPQLSEDWRAWHTQAAEGHEATAAELGERISALDEIQTARDAWWEKTTAVREDADAARLELERRGVGPEAEQQQDRAGAELDQEQPEKAVQEPGGFDLQTELDRAREYSLTIDEPLIEREAEPEVELGADEKEHEIQQGAGYELDQEPELAEAEFGKGHEEELESDFGKAAVAAARGFEREDEMGISMDMGE